MGFTCPGENSDLCRALTHGNRLYASVSAGNSCMRLPKKASNPCSFYAHQMSSPVPRGEANRTTDDLVVGPKMGPCANGDENMGTSTGRHTRKLTEEPH